MFCFTFFSSTWLYEIYLRFMRKRRRCCLGSRPCSVRMCALRFHCVRPRVTPWCWKPGTLVWTRTSLTPTSACPLVFITEWELPWSRFSVCHGYRLLTDWHGNKVWMAVIMSYATESTWVIHSSSCLAMDIRSQRLELFQHLLVRSCST